MNFDLPHIKRLMKHASQSPFFRRKMGSLKARAIVDLKGFGEKVPVTRLEELVAEKIRSGDPYSSRWYGKRSPLVVFQLDYDTESALYLPLDRGALRDYAEALRRCWTLLGLKKGDAVAIFDYGTSPVSYLASSAFTPYLKQGAAEALSCLPVCNDGIASMSQRAVEILKYVRPRILFIRTDCLQPFATEVEGQLPRLSDHTHALVVSENEGVLSKADQHAFEGRLGVPIYRLLRIDVALFLAVECPECRLFHSWEDFYWIESVNEDFEESSSDSADRYLAITNWFARFCPSIRYLSQIKASLAPKGCHRSPGDIRIAA